MHLSPLGVWLPKKCRRCILNKRQILTYFVACRLQQCLEHGVLSAGYFAVHAAGRHPSIAESVRRTTALCHLSPRQATHISAVRPHHNSSPFRLCQRAAFSALTKALATRLHARSCRTFPWAANLYLCFSHKGHQRRLIPGNVPTRSLCLVFIGVCWAA